MKAEETVSNPSDIAGAAACATSVKTRSAPLEDVAHCQSNRLHDVSALLKAIQASAEAIPDRATEIEMASWRDRIHRLARVADDVLEDVQGAFQPYI